MIRMVADGGSDGRAMIPLIARVAKWRLARRIHNDLVVRAQGLHRRRRVRWFRLAGHAAWPTTIEFDALDDFG